MVTVTVTVARKRGLCTHSDGKTFMVGHRQMLQILSILISGSAMQDKSKAPAKAKGKGCSWKQKAPEKVMDQPQVFTESETTVGERTSAESLLKRSARPKQGKKAVMEPDAEAMTVTPKVPQSCKF